MITYGSAPARWRTMAGLPFLLVSLAGTPSMLADESGWTFERAGRFDAAVLDEVSGIAPLPDGRYVVHTDDGPPRIHVVDADGSLRASIGIEGSFLQDWEDLTTVAGPDGPLLAIGDIGDNAGVRRAISIYFVDLPRSDDLGRFPDNLPLRHALELRYPDGPRDAEALAFDPVVGRLLILTKRDKPPRLYGIGLSDALTARHDGLEFLGEVPGLRPPGPIDLLIQPFRGLWVSQPTGLEISPDGRLAALITYRSLYLFTRAEHETWPEALRRTPTEIHGPPGSQDEAVTFDVPGRAVIVAAEGEAAPLYRLPLGEEG